EAALSGCRSTDRRGGASPRRPWRAATRPRRPVPGAARRATRARQAGRSGLGAARV
ncbi:MAG: hypothetical protein AVDCRST_MAG40-2589, partial [uncultured Gemmatimonadaceae bacterium]